MDGSDALLLLLVFAIAYAMNVVPVLGPPLWTVIAFFVVKFELPLIPTTIGATFCASWGRLTLTRITAHYGRSIIRAQQEDVDAVSEFVEHRRRTLFPFSLFYSIALPTAWLFMAAGIVRVPLRPIFFGYWFSRATVDTVLVLGARTASEQLVRGSTIGLQALIAQALGILSFLLFLRLPWVRWLSRLTRSANNAAE